MLIAVIVTAPVDIILKTLIRYPGANILFVISLNKQREIESLREKYPEAQFHIFSQQFVSESLLPEIKDLFQNKRVDMVNFQVRKTEISRYRDVLKVASMLDIPLECSFYHQNVETAGIKSEDALFLSKKPEICTAVLRQFSVRSVFHKGRPRFSFYHALIFLRIMLYPLIQLFVTPVRLAKTLFNARVLLTSEWKKYYRFTPGDGINSTFYWTLAESMHEYGSTGTDPYLGLGAFKLSNFFTHSRPALYFDRKFAPFTAPAGMFGWLLANLVWAFSVDLSWTAGVLLLTMISTLFYVNAFSHQNYNVLGWMFFPLGLYGFITGNLWLSAASWLAASFFSITVVFVGGLFALMLMLRNWSFFPLITMIPAVLKYATHLIPLWKAEEIKGAVTLIAKAIGVSRKKVLYVRKSREFTTPQYMYFLFLYLQFMLFHYYRTGTMPEYFLYGTIIFIANHFLARFGDLPTFNMITMSTALACTVMSRDPFMLIPFWLVISPMPLLLNFSRVPGVVDTVPELTPFKIEPLLRGIEAFVSGAGPDSKVLMAFENPNGDYNNLFDSCSTLVSALQYICHKNRVLLIPTWMSVFECNYEGAPQFWGRNCESAIRNMESFEANFLIVYQPAGTALDPEWSARGLEVTGRFNWADHMELLNNFTFNAVTPEWWLLRRTSTNSIPLQK
ncbi:MAG: hypothetical protein PHQ23_03205 [Candidatus Wallbacteria bacterium]|nr:hypothetical protein [Candidatus Wallbacteria bacterium]